MNDQIKETDTPTEYNTDSPNHEGDFSRVEEQAKTRAIQREEEVKDAIGSLKVWALRIMSITALVVAFLVAGTLGASLVVALATVTVHVFIPPLGWLTSEQLEVIGGWYSSAAQALFPVLLLLNSWVLYLFSRRFKP